MGCRSASLAGLSHRSQKGKVGTGTHRGVIAGSFGAAHAARRCSMEALLHNQIDGRQLSSLQPAGHVSVRP